jgi:hypothetical protein
MWPACNGVSMCGNRVEELESRVKELEASVEGLTDELVECKVRLRELEGAVDEDLGFAPESESAESKPDQTEASDDDMRVPEPGETAEADTSNTEATEESDNTEESESDIIVA